MIKGIIFDFDGVIAESVNVKTVAFQKIYQQYGNEVVSKVIKHHLSNGGISRFEKFKLYHNNFLGIKLKKQQLMELSDEFSKLVVQNVIDAPYVPGAFEFIKNNYKNYDYFISTGTPQDEMINIINKKQLNNYFNSIYGSPEEKTKHVKKIIYENAYSKDEVIFIGDADTDILAAKDNDISIILRVHDDSHCNYNYNKIIKVIDLINIIDVLSSIKN